MLFDILKELVRCEELRIPANDFEILVGIVGEIDEIFDDRKQSLFAEQSFDHRGQRVDPVHFFIIGFYLSPCIKEVIRREEGTVLVVCTVADDDESVILEQLGNVSAITYRELGVRIHDGRVFLDRALEFEHDNGDAVDEYDAVWNAKLLLDAFNLKLIDDLENIVFGSVEINKFNIQVFLRPILTVEDEAVADQLIDSLVCFVNRSRNCAQREHNAFDLVGRDPILGIAIIEVLLQIVCKQHFCSLPMYFVAAKVKIALILEQLHDGHLQCVFVKVRHSVHSLLRIPVCQSAQPINDNLEAQALALFEEQFASMYTTSDLPAGWRKQRLNSICTVKGGKRLPAESELLDYPTDHPYIRVRDVGASRYVCSTDQFQYIDEETHQAISRYIVDTDDIIISIVGTIGLIGKIHSTLNKANLTENCVRLTAVKDITPDYLYYTLCMKKNNREIELLTVGAVQAKLPMYNIQSIEIVIPPNDVIQRFQNRMDIFNVQIEANSLEIHRLEELRSVLLAKLSD